MGHVSHDGDSLFRAPACGVTVYARIGQDALQCRSLPFQRRHTPVVQQDACRAKSTTQQGAEGHIQGEVAEVYIIATADRLGHEDSVGRQRGDSSFPGCEEGPSAKAGATGRSPAKRDEVHRIRHVCQQGRAKAHGRAKSTLPVTLQQFSLNLSPVVGLGQYLRPLERHIRRPLNLALAVKALGLELLRCHGFGINAGHTHQAAHPPVFIGSPGGLFSFTDACILGDDARSGALEGVTHGHAGKVAHVGLEPHLGHAAHEVRVVGAVRRPRSGKDG